LTEPEKFKIADILYGIVVPIIVAIIIIALPVVIGPGVSHALGPSSPVPFIITYGFAQMLTLAVPLLLGLLWNKWAGGAAGFLVGGLYYVAYAGLFSIDYIVAPQESGMPWNFFRDTSVIGYIVNAILIGYMAGALSNKSLNFKRMLGAALTASIITAVIQYILNYFVALAPARDMTTGLLAVDPFQAMLIAFLPNILVGIIIPIIAKVMTWYGIMPGGHY
jgi:threonine/homoserine efflux transporter RhtA